MIPRHIAGRLGKLILLLGSDRDGEALGAARGIRRTLEGAGLDLHALAERVESGPRRKDDEPRPSSAAAFNYANHFRRGRAQDETRTHPDGLASGLGLPLYTPDVIESWSEVGRYCLRLNGTIAKKHGGKFLRPFEVEILTRMAEGQWPRNGQVPWVETVIARCHQARDKAWKAAGAGAGAP